MDAGQEEPHDYFDLPAEEQRMAIKAQVALLVPKGEVKETAYDVGLSAYTLYKARDQEIETHNFLRPELLQIIRRNKGYGFLRWFVGLFNHIALPCPEPAAAIEDISRHIAAIFKETAQVSQTALEAASPESPGGATITLEEYHIIEREISQAQEQLAALKEATWRQAKKEASWGTRVLHRLRRRHGA